MTARSARPVLAVLGALVVSLLLTLFPALPAGATPSAEDDFLSRLNGARAAAGLPGLTATDDLTQIARAHSQEMASSSTLYHNPDLERQVQSWTSLSENVGYGGTVQAVHDALMNSAPHRGNILSGTFSQVGIGVVVAGSRTWVTQVFRKPSASYAPSFAVGGGIGEAWNGYKSVVGSPTSAEYDVPGGRAQNFQRGKIFWGPSTGAHVLWGAILSKFEALGGTAGPLGMPTTSEHDAPGGRRARFQGGQVVWSPSTGAHAVYGGINEHYDALGASGGPLGLPTRDEADAAGLGRYSAFTGGRIYWSPDSGSKEVYGGIMQAYWATGGSAGPLGYPVTGEYDVPGGRRSDFQRGSIRWEAGSNAITVVTR